MTFPGHSRPRRLERPDRPAFPETAPLPEIGHIDSPVRMNGDVERLGELQAFVVFAEDGPVVGDGRAARVEGEGVQRVRRSVHVAGDRGFRTTSDKVGRSAVDRVDVKRNTRFIDIVVVQACDLE